MARGAAKNQADVSTARSRVGHRGFILMNSSFEQAVQIIPSPIASAKLAAYPPKMWWPRITDFLGAKDFLDAVIARDAVKIHQLQAQFPDHDFGLGEYGEKLKADYLKLSAMKREVIRKRTLANGRVLTAEVITDTDTGRRSIVACFYRGKTRMSEQVLAVEPPPEKDTAHV